MIKQISLDELKKLGQNEGLVLQGCGGDLRTWVEGINTTFTDGGILKDGSTFADVYSFEQKESTNLLFMMGKDINL